MLRDIETEKQRGMEGDTQRSKDTEKKYRGGETKPKRQ